MSVSRSRALLLIAGLLSLASIVTVQPAAAQNTPTGRASIAIDALNKFETETPTTMSAANRTNATAALRQLEQVVAPLKADAKALATNVRKTGKVAEFDAGLRAQATKDQISPALVQMVDRAGGPLAVMENADRYINDDLAARRRVLGLPQASAVRNFLAQFNPISSAQAGTGCSVVFYIAYGLCRTGGGSCSSFESANNRHCMGSRKT